MQVIVFISKVDQSGSAPRLLILPDRPDVAIPPHLRDTEWTYFVTTSSNDKLIGAAAARIEAELVTEGYSMVKPTG
jgi:hypothetical protein